MRISDWSSDVCSSDLAEAEPGYLHDPDNDAGHGTDHDDVDRGGACLGDALDDALRADAPALVAEDPVYDQQRGSGPQRRFFGRTVEAEQRIDEHGEGDDEKQIGRAHV